MGSCQVKCHGSFGSGLVKITGCWDPVWWNVRGCLDPVWWKSRVVGIRSGEMSGVVWIRSGENHGLLGFGLVKCQGLSGSGLVKITGCRDPVWWKSWVVGIRSGEMFGVVEIWSGEMSGVVWIRSGENHGLLGSGLVKRQGLSGSGLMNAFCVFVHRCMLLELRNQQFLCRLPMLWSSLFVLRVKRLKQLLVIMLCWHSMRMAWRAVKSLPSEWLHLNYHRHVQPLLVTAMCTVWKMFVCLSIYHTPVLC